MTRRPRIAVVGNCQARPLAQTVSTLFEAGAQITTVAVVHLLKDSDEPAHADALDNADWILAQAVADTYPCRFVQTNALRQRHGAKVLTWPNLFFGGYNPELMYVRDKDRRPLPGPLGDYHSATVLAAWRAGMDIDSALALNSDDRYNRRLYEGAAERALRELGRREALTDIRVADWIRERVWTQRLFFTFNHPAQALIAETARQLCVRAGLAPASTQQPASASEPLSQYRLPMNPWVRAMQGATLQDPEDCAGVEVLEVAPGRVVTGARRQWPLDEAIASFYRIYDVCGADLPPPQKPVPPRAPA